MAVNAPEFFAVPMGYAPAPLQAAPAAARICIFVRIETSGDGGPFLLLREVPGARIYLGALCDARARVLAYLEIQVQTLEFRDLTYSNYQERLTNQAFDLRWQAEWNATLAQRPDEVILTGMESHPPAPLVIHRGDKEGFLPTAASPWELCTDDAELARHSLPAYSTTPYRYLHQPGAEPKTFLSTMPDAPANAQVQGIERLQTGPHGGVIFNPHAGRIGVTHFHPVALEEHFKILEGEPWSPDDGMGGARIRFGRIYAELQAWSSSPKGLPFLLRRAEATAEGMNEIFFLKLATLRAMLAEVRAAVKAHQMPLLNLSPASFRVSLPETGDSFPALWAARCSLVKPGQAYPLKIRSTEQKYFIRLGRVEPSPYLPEGLGAHSFGIGNVRLRGVTSDAEGVALEGTLVAEDYLSLAAHDLLWFKLPLGEQPLEFYAHVYTGEAGGPREARFRTVSAKLAEPVIASLKQAAGTTFQKAPYEIWPLLSSPCDLYSLGVIAVRTLLANHQTPLPVVLDDVLSLTRRVGEQASGDGLLTPQLQLLLRDKAELREWLNPQAMTGVKAGKMARTLIHEDSWIEALGLVLRMFPGAGPHSYCKSFGDVSPLALETIFDPPIEELDSLLLRLRSVLLPSLFMNEEIAGVVLKELEKV